MFDSGRYCACYGCFMQLDTLADHVGADNEQSACSCIRGCERSRIGEVCAAHDDSKGRDICERLWITRGGDDLIGGNLGKQVFDHKATKLPICTGESIHNTDPFCFYQHVLQEKNGVVSSQEAHERCGLSVLLYGGSFLFTRWHSKKD